MNTYGIINRDGIHIDVSNSEKGAKNFATRNGYTKVSIRYNGSCHVSVISVKVANKWVGTLQRIN